MFRQVEDVCPRPMRGELLRLAKRDRNWVKWKGLPDVPGEQPNRYTCEIQQNTWLRKLWSSGADGFSMLALSLWLVDGPKIFRPTQEQCLALEQIEVRLELNEYAQPYPALLIDLPGEYAPFLSVLCHKDPAILNCCLVSQDHLHDITTTVAVDGRPIEVSLQRYDDDCASLAAVSARALRIAINSCLALTNFGYQAELLYPKEAASDTRLARENTPRGERARDRLQTTPHLVTFTQEVILHHTEVRQASQESSEESRREVTSHWRRGHWAMQSYGPSHSLRKRILRKPVLVRADKLLSSGRDISNTITEYRT